MLTKRQKQILDYIKQYISKHEYSPSLEEIAEKFNLSSVSTVHYHLSQLENKGLITVIDIKTKTVPKVFGKLLIKSEVKVKE